MSHFSRLKTLIVEKELLILALKELGYQPEEGELYIRGFGGDRTKVELKVARKFGYEIGFRKGEGTYEVVADWFGVHGISQKDFVQQLNQRYAYHAARVKLEEQGFTLTSEEVQADGRIHLVLRRAA
ncbi:MAG TPA: DUF1257 domain-containing protein [Anaerolineaceae bacterium]|nr:DUF1257 domain-containing protein [Anaerolineaceae bacterium]